MNCPKDSETPPKAVRVKSIRVWNDGARPDKRGPPVVVELEEEGKYIVFSIPEILDILRKFFIREDQRYPPEKGFKGRKMLYEAITAVYKEK